jgi:hypothetical protein
MSCFDFFIVLRELGRFPAMAQGKIMSSSPPLGRSQLMRPSPSLPVQPLGHGKQKGNYIQKKSSVICSGVLQIVRLG